MNKFDITIIIIFFIIVATLIFLQLKKKFNDYNNNDIDNQVKYILEHKPPKENIKEEFIVADAQDFHNYDKLKDNVIKQDSNFDKERINNPPADKKLDYDKDKNPNESTIMVVHGEPKRIEDKKNEKSFITAVDFGWDAPFPTTSCSNSSIDDRYKSGPKKLLPYEISCGYANKITAENFYKTHFTAQAASLEDYAVRGANYMEYSGFTHPSKNVRILSQNTKGLPPDQTKYKNIPTGFNYGFHNTPSMRMP